MDEQGDFSGSTQGQDRGGAKHDHKPGKRLKLGKVVPDE
jgi:hypothetical protein